MQVAAVKSSVRYMSFRVGATAAYGSLTPLHVRQHPAKSKQSVRPLEELLKLASKSICL